MIAENTQSLATFRQNIDETMNRVNETGAAEVITVDGEPRAILLSPQAYDELMLALDVEAMQESIQQLADGQGQDAESFFDQLEAELLASKKAHRDSPT